MARFKAKVKVFVDNIIRNEGDVFDYNGPENDNLEEVDKDGNVIDSSKSKEDPAKDQPVGGTTKAPEKSQPHK